MDRFRVLLVDDEERIVNFLKAKLKSSGYEVITALDGVQALEQLQAQEPDLVVLDLVMPRKDGFQALKEMRAFSAIPVIILSAKGADTDKIKGLELGADDYIPKPFNPDELIARIEAVRRRLRPSDAHPESTALTIGDITIDFQKRVVLIGGKEKRLTRIEWLLLSELARNCGRLMLYEDLLSHVWGPEYRNDIQLLRTWVSRLRCKIESEPNGQRLIRTIPKAGYILDNPSS